MDWAFWEAARVSHDLIASAKIVTLCVMLSITNMCFYSLAQLSESKSQVALFDISGLHGMHDHFITSLKNNTELYFSTIITTAEC